MIELKNIFYTYNSNEPVGDSAVNGISLTINNGEFIGMAGHTGSGKTTIAQIMAGLIMPSSGDVLIDGNLISDKKNAARELRKRVGIVFQYPEHQLFEETVYKDIAFAPKNKGLSEKEIDICVRKSAEMAGLSEELFDKSPFELSGGQKRRVAVAGVLAADHSVLILDEPAAGLDPKGKKDMLSRLRDINIKNKKTVIFISHSMEDLAEYADRIIVLKSGKKILDNITSEIFSNVAE